LLTSIEMRFAAKNSSERDCGAAKNGWYAKRMRDRYRLSGVGDDELLAALSALVRRENDLMSDLLAHLAELDERRLYLDLGYTSLFAYCTEALGFCKSSAGRRIAVVRVCRKYPEAFARVARGELQLSVLSLLSQYLNEDNAAELFEACSRKSCDQVEELLAARFPSPTCATRFGACRPSQQLALPMVGVGSKRCRRIALACGLRLMRSFVNFWKKSARSLVIASRVATS
jgi:hypothetical protein